MSERKQAENSKQNQQDALNCARVLVQPLKVGLAVGPTRLLQVAGEFEQGEVVLAFGAENDAVRFDVLISPRHEDARWEWRTKRFHVRRRALGEGDLPPVSEAVAKAMTKLVERNESTPEAERLEAFLRAWGERYRVQELASKGVGGKLYFRVNTACQLNCVFCCAAEGLDSTFADDVALQKAMDAADLEHASQVTFSGGEPTLSPKLPQFARRAADAGANPVVVQTNGIRLGEPSYLDAWEGLQGVAGFGFSVHAVTEAVNRIVTGRANILAAQWQGIANCIARGFAIHVAFVVTEPNMPEAVQFVDKLADIVGDSPAYRGMYFAYPTFNGNAWENRAMMPDFEHWLAAIAPAYARAAERGLSIHLNEPGSPVRCAFHKYGHADLLKYMLAFGDIAEINPTERRKLACCSRCRYDAVCPGIWHKYLDIFGEREIEAVMD